MNDKLSTYRKAQSPLPKHNWLWNLYGAGLENMGEDGKPNQQPMPEFGQDQLLIRHDACGLCFSDIKVITQGENHPRIQRDMKKEPVVLGHEVAMTVVGVGEQLKNDYKIGDRLTLETDIYVNGVGMAYGYVFQGGLSQYAVIDQRIMNSDRGNNLIPVHPDMGYAEVALIEPWACVVAAYRLEYRTMIKPGGTLWIIGTGDQRDYTVGTGFDENFHPQNLLLTDVPSPFAEWLKNRAGGLGVNVFEAVELSRPPVAAIDDIVILGANPERIEAACPHLAPFGVLAIVAQTALPRRISLDVGRVHYDRWVVTGGTHADIARAFSDQPVRSALKPGGCAWFVGAGGPVGRMHVQHAIQFPDPPSVIVCTDISDMRLEEMCVTFSAEAAARGIEFICLNPTNQESYQRGMARFFATGFDDAVVLVPAAAVIADAASHVAVGGTVNVFAGVARGTMVELDLSDAYLKGVHVIGHSGSIMSDMQITLQRVEAGELTTNRSVAAVGSLSAARDGLQAVKDASLPGKVVIYPHIKDFPLTALPDLKERLSSVFERLHNGREWNNEAEQELLNLLLP